MRKKRLQSALHCLLLAGAAALSINAQTPSSQPALDAKTISITVVYAHSGGVVRLNGIPIDLFGNGDPKSGDTGTLFIGNGVTNYGRNGVNELSVETKPSGSEKDASTELIVYDASAEQSIDHPLFRKKIAGAGAIQYSLTLRNLPHRLFDDATPWHGDPQAVLAAVRQMHKALVARDMKTVAGFLRPTYDFMAEADQKQIGGFDNMMAQFENSLKGSKMLELAAELDVESYYDGRLFRVSGADGLAPLRSASTKLGADGKPDEILEMGSFWCYRNGAWYPLGD